MLANWNPLDDLLHFEDLFNGRAPRRQAAVRRPAVDILEREDAFVLTADVPGLCAKDIEIDLDGNVLSLRAERNDERNDDKGGYHRVERSSVRLERSFVLPDSVERAGIEARVADGVLELSLPKRKESLPRRIAVKTGTTELPKAKA
jgi:HSP20 family protein